MKQVLCRPWITVLFGAVVLLGGGCRTASPRLVGEVVSPIPVARSVPTDEREHSAAAAPLDFLRECRDHYLATVRDYRGVFSLRERVNGVLRPAEVIDIRFREEPFSVNMEWVENARRAARVTYVANRWVRNGRQLALVKPAGLLAWLVPAGVKRYIHAPEMLAESRRPIDKFGFRNTLELIIDYCEKAQGHPDFSLRYLGIAEHNERECFVLQRTLPFTGVGGSYPDCLLTVYIDREWLVPVGCVSYLDAAGEQLLGSYSFADVEFNVGLTDRDF